MRTIFNYLSLIIGITVFILIAFLIIEMHYTIKTVKSLNGRISFLEEMEKKTYENWKTMVRILNKL